MRAIFLITGFVTVARTGDESAAAVCAAGVELSRLAFLVLCGHLMVDVSRTAYFIVAAVVGLTG
jgi:hypothetical protein